MMDRPSSPLSSLPSDDGPHISDAEEEMPLPNPDPTLSSTPASQAPRRRGDDRLDTLLRTLKSMRWSMKDVLKEVNKRKEEVSYRENMSYQRTWASFRKFAYEEVPDQNPVFEAIGLHPSAAMEAWAFDIVAKRLRNELKELATHEAFGHWTVTALEDADDPTFEKMVGGIIQKAPKWLHLLDATIGKSRKRTFQQYAADNAMVFSILSRSAQPKKSTKMASTLGIYLYHAGTKRRAIDTLHGLGVCASYRSIQRLVGNMEEAAAREVRLLGQNATSVVTYDNFEWQEGRRGERLGDQRPGLRSITTALVIEDRLKLTEPLNSAMWQPQRFLLSGKRIYNAIMVDMRGLRLKMRLYHMETAIKSVITDQSAIADIRWTTESPVSKRLPPAKTRYLPLRPIMKNESFTVDNIQIMEDILYKQFDLAEDDAAIQTGFRMFSGDLKTWDRMQSVKTIRQETAECRVDSFEWLIPTIGFWHLLYNMAMLIHKTHWGEARQADQSHLQFAADRWNRTQAVDGKKYEAVVELLVHSYHSRIVAALLAHLSVELHLTITKVDELIIWLKQQDKTSLETVLNAISAKLDPIDGGQPLDDIYNNHQKFCFHMETFLSLRYAIKHADVDIIRHALRFTTLLFLSKEARTPKYAKGLLYTLHLVDSPAADPTLRDYVLANSIVNLQGKEDTNFELDRLLELLNGKLKRFQKERTNFATNRSDEVLQRWALVGPMLDRLQGSVERPFGSWMSGKHTVKNADEDIFSMAILLSTSSLLIPRKNRFSRHLATDLFELGLGRLGSAVLHYNRANDSDIYTEVAMQSTFTDEASSLHIPECSLADCNPLQDDQYTQSEVDTGTE